jgi:hypothetical protein
VADRLKARKKATDGVQYLNRLCMLCDFPRLSAGKQRMRGLWAPDYNLTEQPNENPSRTPCLQAKAAILRRIAAHMSE